MEALLAAELPEGDGWQYEPKWDGFRCLARRIGGVVTLTSKSGKPLARYFPEVVDILRSLKSTDFLLDGELIIPVGDALSFDALQLRLHPAESRVRKLAREAPAELMAFDLLELDGKPLAALPLSDRRQRLERFFRANHVPGLHLSPMTSDRQVALGWLQRSGGALDGVIAKRANQDYRSGERAMIKVKHDRTADCVVGGFRWHKDGEGVGSLLLGLYDDAGVLQHVGVTSSFTMAKRKALVKELAPLRRNAMRDHPWREWAGAAAESTRMPGAQSRWSAGKNLAWEPLRPERVCEVKYDHLQGNRFRHAATFLRWRPDKPPEDCRYDQLEITARFELASVFEAASSTA
jgi:ATP-dependent DNA ligase